MKIVHFDIKPDNLMWSPHFKREVFIDFGLSEIFEEGQGFKYPIKFKGSLNYCS
jgi:serine/threonine protein kinase